jgi:hypothetical protein
VVAGEGVLISGVWGLGGETSGTLTLGEPGPGKVVVTDSAGAGLLARLKESGATGLVTGGLNLKDMLGAEPSFTIVVTGGFGAGKMAPEILSLLKTREGSLALLDGTTQMRVGVRRPKIILPAA